MISLLRSRTAWGALAAGLGLVSLVAPAVAQPSARLDGYCYVRQSDMQRNSAVDSYGVKRSFARCYNGVYYAFEGDSYAAPAAPDGYQVAYYTQRPGMEYYDRVVDADSRYASSSSRYSSNTYTGNDRYATTSADGSSYGSSYGATAYGDDGYDRYGRADGNYRAGSDAYDDGRDDSDGYDQDRDYRRGGDRYRGDDRDYTRQTPVEGWRDDSGRWHVGRPRAIGWQDDNGRWHEGEVEAYGWRDARGQWHESGAGADNRDGADSRYSY